MEEKYLYNDLQNYRYIQFNTKTCGSLSATNYDYPVNMFTVKELKDILAEYKDTDSVSIEEDEGNYSLILREFRLWTEEDSKTVARFKETAAEQGKEARKKQYLKLKEEFEPNV